MKFSINALLGLAVASAVASPLEDRQNVQVAHLTFHGGPASYSLSVPADGREVPTNNGGLAIDTIDTPDYNALAKCTFKTAGGAKVTLEPHVTPQGLQQILVGPPTPFTAVSCH